MEEFLFDNVKLVIVSKKRTENEILYFYKKEIKDFGENKVQELLFKYKNLPSDINWHLIGHLQTNKVKYIAEFVYLIHSVDSFKLLKEINKQAKKHNRIIDFLFQVKIAEEDSKYGLNKKDLLAILENNEYKQLENVNLKGLMGMATATSDKNKIKSEFLYLKTIFDIVKRNKNIDILSMGMSADYKIAIEKGSNMIRIGTAIFEKIN